MSILVNVVNQKMHISSTMEGIVAGSQQFVKFRFNLSEEWDGLVTFAQFMQNGVAYNQYLDYENAAYLPAEIGVGTCTLMLYGSLGTTIGTTNYLTLKINENIFVSDASSTDISESLYDQLVAQVAAYQTNLDSEISRAKAAEEDIATRVQLKANQSQVDELALKVDEALNNGVSFDTINAAVKKEFDAYVASGALSNLALQDGSVTKEKLASDVSAAIEKAENAGNMDFKGMVAKWEDLPQAKNTGDTYGVMLGTNLSIVTWNGSEWLFHAPLPENDVVEGSGGLVTSGAIYNFVSMQINSLMPTLDTHGQSITNLLNTVPVGSTLLRYSGQVPNYAYVERTTNARAGDVLFCADESRFYMWDGTEWKKFGSSDGSSGGNTETNSLPTKRVVGEFITAENVYTSSLADMVLFGTTRYIGSSRVLTSTAEDAGEVRTVVLGENLCTETKFDSSIQHAVFSTPTLSPITLAVKAISGNAQVNYKLEYVDGDRLDASLVEFSDINGVWVFKAITPAKPITSITLYNVTDNIHTSRTADGIFIGFGDYNESSLITDVPNGLCGIPVTNPALANYIDDNGQTWCCDTVDYGREKYTRRIGVITDYSDEEITGEYLSSTGELSEGSTIYYVLSEPIETELTANEMARFNALHITAPAATIFNDRSAPMEVEYYISIYSAVYDAVMKELENNPPAGWVPSAKIADITILANAWVGEDSPYSQVVAVDGVTNNSQVDLTPSVEQLAIFYNKDLAFVTENDDGIVTVYAIGQKPANDYVIQATIKEVAV